MRLAVVFVLVALLAGGVCAADINAVLTPQEARIGDTLWLDLRVNGAQGRPVSFPLKLGDEFAVLRIDSSQVAKASIIRYVVAVYDTGRQTLSDVPVIVGRGAQAETLRTPPVSVHIPSLLAADTSRSVRPNKPYREHPFQWRELLAFVWIPIALLVALAAWWLWKRYFRKGAKEEILARALMPPHEEALRDLIALKDKKYPARGMLKEFFSDYSQIMRHYLERRYEFPALEMTTFDLERELADSRFPDVWEKKLLPVLREADLVKFAKHVPDFSRCDAHIELGFELVMSTKPAPQLEAADDKVEETAA